MRGVFLHFFDSKQRRGRICWFPGGQGCRLSYVNRHMLHNWFFRWGRNGAVIYWFLALFSPFFGKIGIDAVHGLFSVSCVLYFPFIRVFRATVSTSAALAFRSPLPTRNFNSSSPTLIASRGNPLEYRKMILKDSMSVSAKGKS